MQPPNELYDVFAAIPNVIADVRYASDNNFTGIQLYNHQLAWLRREPLEHLAAAAAVFADDGLNVVIYDAFRPRSVQNKLRQFCDNNDYVLEVSNHCRGITIDMTLAYATGNYLDMGTDYDEFSERAHPDYAQLSDEQHQNRELLRITMLAQGFSQHPHEWWHFDYQPDKQWALIEDELNTFTA